MSIKKTLLGLIAATTMIAPAFAEYPERPIELTIPAGAGGGTDTSARKLGILLEEALGTSIAVLNVGGGGVVSPVDALLGVGPNPQHADLTLQPTVKARLRKAAPSPIHAPANLPAALSGQLRPAMSLPQAPALTA